jgi:hypothetical protein
MEAISGVVTILCIVLALTIGVRVARLGRQTSGAEIWLSIYFMLTQFAGVSLSCFLYMSWTDASRALPDPIAVPLHAAAVGAANLGLAALYIFVWKTFYPRSTTVRRIVGCLLVAMAAAYLAIPMTEGFTVRVMPGSAYWTSWVLREGAVLWLAFESLRYWSLLRRRMRIGLGEPLVTNRFLLLGIFALAIFHMGASDPLARTWYVLQVGSTEQWIPELAHSIVLTVLALTSTLGIVVVTTLALIFFPTARFRRFIERRYNAPAEATASPSAPWI